MGQGMIIRPMEPREIDSVVILFNYYRDAASIDPERYDENRVIMTVREYNIRPNLFFRVAFSGQTPVGLIGGFLSEDPVESEVAATVQFLYLRDDHANINNYQLMLEEFESWARTFSVSAIRCIDIGNNIDRLRSVYDQLGFDPIRISIMNKEIS